MLQPTDGIVSVAQRGGAAIPSSAMQGSQVSQGASTLFWIVSLMIGYRGWRRGLHDRLADVAMPDSDDKKVKDLLDAATQRELENWFKLPSFDQAAEQAPIAEIRSSSRFASAA